MVSILALCTDPNLVFFASFGNRSPLSLKQRQPTALRRSSGLAPQQRPCAAAAPWHGLLPPLPMAKPRAEQGTRSLRAQCTALGIVPRISLHRKWLDTHAMVKAIQLQTQVSRGRPWVSRGVLGSPGRSRRGLGGLGGVLGGLGAIRGPWGSWGGPRYDLQFCYTSMLKLIVFASGCCADSGKRCWPQAIINPFTEY